MYSIESMKQISDSQLQMRHFEVRYYEILYDITKSRSNYPASLTLSGLDTSMNHIIRNAGSIYSKTAAILKSMAASAVILHEANFWFKRFA